MKDKTTLDQIRNGQFITVARTLARTSLDLIDFERIQLIRNEDYDIVVREYMLLKTGMFESWEILYRYG